MAKRTNPKRPYPRMVRVNELLREVVAEALQDIDDDRLVDVAVTNVQCDADLANAVVHYDVLAGADADDEVIEAFEELRPRLQAIINRETRLKGTPKLTFAPDPVVRSAARIDDVLRGLHAHEPAGDPTP
ncbi:MAG TPA: 30S ribosome-binding factor RbfA [Iamia sp.]|jgi:ribosome-binding factor A